MKRVEQLIKELNSADEARLIELSALPFLLDGETIAREEDLRVLWRNLRETGFSFGEAAIIAIDPVGPDSYKAFSDNPEVAAFFSKYTAKDAAVIKLECALGVFLIITGDDLCRVPKIFGFTGPGA